MLTEARQTLFPPDFYVEVRLNLQLDAQVEKRAAERVEHMRIVGRAEEGDMDHAIDGLDLAEFSGPLQNPLVNCRRERTFYLFSTCHWRLPYKPKFYPTKQIRPGRGRSGVPLNDAFNRDHVKIMTHP